MTAEQLANSLVSWIKEQVIGAGCRGTVLGISGGIDSAVAAVLCKRAFPDTTMGIILPCHSIDEDRQHALLLAEKFSIPTETVVLDGIYDAFIESLKQATSDSPNIRLAESNLKPRLRMVTIYYFANLFGYMVVGSSNRSELTTGYFTKFGDGGVDIMPLGNLVKKQVRELASCLGVPQPIIDKPPSAGLWPGQTDEAEMGLTYEELDACILTGNGSPELKARLAARSDAARHKLIPPPVAKF